MELRSHYKEYWESSYTLDTGNTHTLTHTLLQAHKASHASPPRLPCDHLRSKEGDES